MLFLEKLAQEALKNMPPEPEKEQPKNNTTMPLMSKQMLAETLMDVMETMARRSVIH